MDAIGIGGVAAAVLLFVAPVNSVRGLPGYERGAVGHLGRLRPYDCGPGLFFLVPLIDRMRQTSLRTFVNRAKILLRAEGESQAGVTLVAAVRELSQGPAPRQFRYMPTLTELTAERRSTIAIPPPIELLRSIGR